jgi:DNA adenine methylase
MPVYQGGKSRIGKEIYEVIKHYEQKLHWKSSSFFEPFCGMLGVGIFAAREKRNVIACDFNEDLILMWQALQKGWMPRKNEFSKAEYERYKYSKVHSPTRGFVGICCAFGGIFFAGYRIQANKGGTNNSVVQFKKALQTNFLPYLKHITFLPAQSYDDFEPEGATIYADPPYYKNNYDTTNELFQFDHKHFWQTMRKWSKHNLVFISEYVAPADFVCVWKKDISLKEKQKTEKLFMHNMYFR